MKLSDVILLLESTIDTNKHNLEYYANVNKNELIDHIKWLATRSVLDPMLKDIKYYIIQTDTKVLQDVIVEDMINNILADNSNDVYYIVCTCDNVTITLIKK